MKRDLNKAIKEGKEIAHSRSALDLRASEIAELKDRFDQVAKDKGQSNAVYYLIHDVYLAGLAVGQRNR